MNNSISPHIWTHRATFNVVSLFGDLITYLNNSDSDLVDSDLVDSDLVDSDLVDSDLVDSDLVDSDLVDSDLVDSDLVDSDCGRDDCGDIEGFSGALAIMVTTALHDGQLPCWPSAEAGSCFEKEQ
jgi:uncharacterized protein YjbI with pentapeptide repeats